MGMGVESSRIQMAPHAFLAFAKDTVDSLTSVQPGKPPRPMSSFSAHIAEKVDEAFTSEPSEVDHRA